jgi:hypothetical protein
MVLDVSHHLFFINNLKSLNSNVIKKIGHFLRFRWLKTSFLSIDFSEDKRKNGEIFMIRCRVLCGPRCEPSLVLHKKPQNFEFKRHEKIWSFSAFSLAKNAFSPHRYL